MVPVIAANGASFNGAFRYYCHDKQGRTTERVAWTQTINMLTDCVAKAWKVMAYTAMHQDRLKEVSGQKATGRKLRKPVFAFSLSWAPEQQPDKPTMLEAAKRSLEALGLGEHQAIIVAHSDRPHRHVHIVANTVHPMTGLVAQLKHTKRKLSDFALQYEREGGKIYCARREENHAQRQRGETTRYDAPDIAAAWRATTSGQEFKAALEANGYVLAHGRKRLVIVDPYGKTHNPARLLKNVRAADIRARLADVDLSLLPEADEAASTVKRKREAGNDRKENDEARSANDPPREQKAEAEPPQDSGQETDLTSTPDHDESAEPGPDAIVHVERSAFEELAALRLAEQIARHEDERRREKDRLRQRLAATKERLAAFHDLPGRKESLRTLRESIETAPWWKRLLGVTRSDKQRMQEDMQSYREAVSRYKESVAHARTQARASFGAVLDRQEAERRRLETHIALLRERNETFRGPEERAPSRAETPIRERKRETPAREL